MQSLAQPRSLSRIAVISLSMVLALSLSGCAASEKASFTNHLTATIAAGPAGNSDVAIAFADHTDVPATAVARRRDRSGQ
jgi:hypothetical protein